MDPRRALIRQLIDLGAAPFGVEVQIIRAPDSRLAGVVTRHGKPVRSTQPILVEFEEDEDLAETFARSVCERWAVELVERLIRERGAEQ